MRRFAGGLFLDEGPRAHWEPFWSEEGPRIVREFFLACENLEQRPALLGVRTPYGVKSFWRVKMSPVMCESCNIFPES
jgi:hypothetical protein